LQRGIRAIDFMYFNAGLIYRLGSGPAPHHAW
jgi:hypothetical protein